MIPQKFMLLAGEASGDTLGAELIRALKAQPRIRETSRPVTFFGAGGEKMEAAGMELVLNLVPHAVVGIWEVLKNYGKFKQLFNQLLDEALRRKPDVVILIDYPGFNLRFAKALRNQSRGSDWKPKIVFYVSPQIWAWRESRIHEIARNIDLMLSIFPFEKAWYAARKPDFKVEFVGHPLVERFAETRTRPAPSDNAPRKGENALVVLLPGSRVREINKHLPVILEAVAILNQKVRCAFRLVVPDEALERLVKTHLPATPAIEVQRGGLAEALSEARLAIASSGTVTMECAFFGVPTVVLYKTSAVTYFLGKRIVRVKYIAMPNLLSDSMIYPEFIQGAATGETLAAEGLDLLNNSKRRGVVKEALGKVIESLGGPGASARAAEAVLKLFPDR